MGELTVYRDYNIQPQWIERTSQGRRENCISKISRQRCAGLLNRASGLKWGYLIITSISERTFQSAKCFWLASLLFLVIVRGGKNRDSTFRDDEIETLKDFVPSPGQHHYNKVLDSRLGSRASGSKATMWVKSCRENDKDNLEPAPGHQQPNRRVWILWNKQ